MPKVILHDQASLGDKSTHNWSLAGSSGNKSRFLALTVRAYLSRLEFMEIFQLQKGYSQGENIEKLRI